MPERPPTNLGSRRSNAPATPWLDHHQKAHLSVIGTLYRVLLPALDDQQRIAACLSSLDARIAAETEKLAALNAHKKGLMQ